MICNMGITLEIDFQDLQKCNKALFLKTSEYKSSSSSSFPRPLFFQLGNYYYYQKSKGKGFYK